MINWPKKEENRTETRDLDYCCLNLDCDDNELNSLSHSTNLFPLSLHRETNTTPFEPAYLLALIRSMIDNRRRVQHLLLTNTTALDIPDDELSPDEAMPGAKLSAQDTKFMDTIYEYMEKHLSDAKLDIDELVGIVMMSRSKFFYKIKGLTGESPNAFSRYSNSIVPPR